LAGVDRLMSEAISCGGGSILLSGGVEGEHSLVGRGGYSGFWFLLDGRPLAVRNLDLRLCGCGAGSVVRVEA